MSRAVFGLIFLAACASHDAVVVGTADASDDSPATVDAAAVRPAAPVTALAGEIHLHQFPLGSHPFAIFVRDAVDLRSIRGDSFADLVPAPTLVDGACTLYVVPSCSPPCAAGSWCASPNACAPIPNFAWIDGGAITVTGSAVVPTIRLWFDASSSDYLSDPPAGGTPLFAGGEQLHVIGAGPALAFDELVPAPLPVSLASPDPSIPLTLPLQGALPVAWTARSSDTIEIVVTASADDGASAYVRCLTTDGGALSIPAAMIAALPRPPRTTRLEVDRVEQRIVPTQTPGAGVLLHVAQTTWVNGRDP